MISAQYKWIALGLLLLTSAEASSIHPRRGMSSDEIYNELIDMNISCGHLDSCQSNRTTEDLRVVNCQCGPICAKLGTCCLDSEYRNLPVDEEAKRIAPLKLIYSPQIAFMVVECTPQWNGDNGIRDLCRISRNDAYTDPFLLAPVTNPRTGITYKNYYCFVCNEEDSTDVPVVWELHLYSVGNVSLGLNPNLYWHQGDVGYKVDGREIYISMAAPHEISSQVNWYRQDVISTCAAGWTDASTKEKCEGYTALVYLKREYRSPIYRNPHCAICNDRIVSELVCTEPIGNEIWGGPPYGTQFVGLFSLEDKVSRCPRNTIFDRFSKKCRYVRCRKNQRMVDGTCVDSRPIRTSEETVISTEAPSSSREFLASSSPEGFQWNLGPRTTSAPPEMTSRLLSTEMSTTTRIPRPSNQGGVRLPSGPKASTGRDRPRPPRTN